jgi:hypothetical protein
MQELQAKVFNNQYNWDLLNSDRMSNIVVDSEGVESMVIEFPNQKSKELYLPEFQMEVCKHPKWTEESAENGWRSSCTTCATPAAGSGQ